MHKRLWYNCTNKALAEMNCPKCGHHMTDSAHGRLCLNCGYSETAPPKSDATSPSVPKSVHIGKPRLMRAVYGSSPTLFRSQYSNGAGLLVVTLMVSIGAYTVIGANAANGIMYAHPLESISRMELWMQVVFYICLLLLCAIGLVILIKLFLQILRHDRV